ncbi:MAG: histidine phosphatase family protein [Chloroflexota bacterium]|nr:histidine phosphatase family protein [Chloroflexota bacterium]
MTMTVKRILFIRPGETDWNRAGKQQGIVAAPLNALGKKQADKLATFIRVLGDVAMYASTTKRAAETAQIIAERLGSQPIIDDRLRERSVGHWQGLTVAEIKAWYADEYAELQSVGDTYRIPGGDSRADVQARMTTAIDDILKNSASETVLVISHTTAIKMALRALIADVEAQMDDLTNTSVTTIARDGEGGAWRLIALDDVSHLEGMETQSVVEPEDKS